MNSQLRDLVDRMTVEESVTDSRDSIAWNAYREAERLRDLSTASELDVFIDSEPNYRRRSAAYFIVGKIGKNTGSERCTRMLLSHAPRELNKHALASLLEGLAELRIPASLDLSPVFGLMEDERWIVRHAAIRSLRHADAQEAESQLLQHASRTADAYDLSYVNEALASIGTKRSAPYLSSAARSRKEHVASSALHALSMIAGRAYLPLYIQLLETGRRAVKWGAMVAVAAHGDATAIPAVLRRISRILAKKRTIPQFPLSDLSIGVTFLHQFRGSDPRVDRFFDRILPRKLEYLIGDEPRQILGLIHGQVHQGAREDP